MRFAAVRQTYVAAKAFLELRRNERLTRPQLEGRKLLKFRRLVAHAARYSPYYAQLIQDHEIAIEHCTPKQFPLLTKSVLMANFDRIVTDRRVSKRGLDDLPGNSIDPNERFLGEYQVIHTSGSSGEVGYFVYSLSDWAHAMAQFLRTSSSSRLFRRTRVAEFFAVGPIGSRLSGGSRLQDSYRPSSIIGIRISLRVKPRVQTSWCLSFG
jgi:phenylacetate-coenzyme A ligase PaaK-like adenylate-forming protein